MHNRQKSGENIAAPCYQLGANVNFNIILCEIKRGGRTAEISMRNEKLEHVH